MKWRPCHSLPRMLKKTCGGRARGVATDGFDETRRRGFADLDFLLQAEAVDEADLILVEVLRKKSVRGPRGSVGTRARPTDRTERDAKGERDAARLTNLISCGNMLSVVTTNSTLLKPDSNS